VFVSAFFLISSSVTTQPCALVLADHIRLSSPNVTMRDVLGPACAPITMIPEFGRIVISRVPEGQDSLTLSRGQLNRFVLRAVPGLNLVKVADGLKEVQISYSHPRAVLVNSSSCYRAKEDVSRGSIVSNGNLEPIACDAKANAVPVVYDPIHNVTRSAANAAAAVYFGALALPIDIPSSNSTHVDFLVNIGAVTIEKTVTLLQPASNGQRAFVRDNEGNVFSMRLIAPVIAESK
jgi:hypothetical protein